MSRRTRMLAGSALLLFAAALIAGCGSSSDTSSTTSSTSTTNTVESQLQAKLDDATQACNDAAGQISNSTAAERRAGRLRPAQLRAGQGHHERGRFGEGRSRARLSTTSPRTAGSRHPTCRPARRRRQLVLRRALGRLRFGLDLSVALDATRSATPARWAPSAASSLPVPGTRRSRRSGGSRRQPPAARRSQAG